MNENNSVTLAEFSFVIAMLALFACFVLAVYDRSEACSQAKCPDGTTPAMVRATRYNYLCACVFDSSRDEYLRSAQ